MNALRRIWQVRAVVDALHTKEGLDAAPGEVEMSGKVDGQTTPGLLEGNVEVGSARRRLFHPSATVCAEGEVSHMTAGSQRGCHRWR